MEDREMALDEWMERLPKHHCANRELAQLRDALNLALEAVGAENDKVKLAIKALRTISAYDKDSEGGEGICPYGCDCPDIARRALSEIDKPKSNV